MAREARHARAGTGANFRVGFKVDARRRKGPPKPAPTEPPPSVRTVALAEEWQGLLDRGEVRSHAELARRVGRSGTHVGNVLRLLRLHPDILAWIKALPLGTPPRLVTERRLRVVARLPLNVQLRLTGTVQSVGSSR